MPKLQPILVALVLALVPLAGCLGGAEEPVAPASDEGVAQDPAAAPETVQAEAPDAAVDATVADAAPALVPFSWDGKVGRTACIPSGPNSCRGPPASLGDGDSFEETGHRPSRATLALTWTPQTPATEELWLALVAVKTCGDSCWEFRVVQDASGPSPLAFDDVALDLAEDETLGVQVSTALPTCHHVVVVFGCARAVEQAFRVEGVLTVPATAA